MKVLIDSSSLIESPSCWASKCDISFKHAAYHLASIFPIRTLNSFIKWRISKYLEKRPAEAGKGTALHQDSHYLPNEPNTLMACWLAMSDTDGENGGLCVVAGSHTVGLYSTHKAANLKDHRMWESEHLMRDRGGREWKEKFYSFEIDNLDTSRVLNLKVPKGSGVFFSSHTIHGSYGDKSAGRIRRAFATHFVDESTWVFRADVQNVVPAI